MWDWCLCSAELQKKKPQSFKREILYQCHLQMCSAICRCDVWLLIRFLKKRFNYDARSDEGVRNHTQKHSLCIQGLTESSRSENQILPYETCFLFSPVVLGLNHATFLCQKSPANNIYIKVVVVGPFTLLSLSPPAVLGLLDKAGLGPWKLIIFICRSLRRDGCKYERWGVRFKCETARQQGLHLKHTQRYRYACL